MHCTRVTVLKLSFNGRQCQKLSFSISPVFVSIVEAFRCSSVIRYDFAKNRSTISARLGGFESFENMVS